MMGLATCALVAVGSMAEAQRTVANTQGPAEIPPASFSGSQYVDSRGCVFIRAGVGGATRWVPRVNRDRTVVCGQPASRPATTTTAAAERPAPTPAATPTVQAAEPVIARQPAAAAPRTIVEPAPRVTAPPPVANASAPAATTVRRAPRPARAAAPRPAPQRVATAPRRTALPVPAGCGASDLSARYLRNTPACAAALQARAASAPTATVAPTVSTAPATPRRAVRRTPAPAAVTVAPPAAAVRVNPAAPSPNRARSPATATRGCSGASELSSRYLRNATRCWGEPAPSADRRSSAKGLVERVITAASSRSAPRVVVVPAARTTFDTTRPPAGYRPAFRDGRLNPNRGPRTLEGDFQSQAIWTNDTPRRLRPVVLVRR